MAAPPTETRRDLDSAATSHRGDRIFNRGITAAAFTALLVLAGIAIFLGIAAVEAITTQGWSFLFTRSAGIDDIGCPRHVDQCPAFGGVALRDERLHRH